MTNQSKKIAGFWVRLASITIDILVLLVVNILILRLIIHLLSSGAFLFFILLVPVVTTILYFGWLNANGRQPPGKKFFGIAVTGDSFLPVSLARSFWRAFSWCVDSVIVLGHLLMWVRNSKQTLHDMITKTYVIRVKAPRRLEWLSIVTVLLLRIILSSLLRSSLRHDYLQAFRFSTGSMKPTMLVGDFIMADKFWAKNSTPERGDLIVFKYPPDPTLEYLKRCIAAGGDTVDIIGDKVLINGVAEGASLDLGQRFDPEDGMYVRRTRIKTPAGKEYVIRHFVGDRSGENKRFIVPEKHYFVMGDNRDNSADSRSWGFLPQENVTGKAGLVYWSWNRLNPWTEKVRWSRIGKTLR